MAKKELWKLQARFMEQWELIRKAEINTQKYESDAKSRTKEE